MASLTDILSAIQNGVTAASAFVKQLQGSVNNISSQLTTLQSSGVKSIAGNIGAFTLNGTSGLTNTVNDIKISPASTSQFGSVKVDGTTITAVGGVISAIGTRFTTSLSSDVALNNVGTYFDGPTIAQGSSGVWWASGTATVGDTGAAAFQAKLWDGTNIIASTEVFALANGTAAVPLSGFIVNPSSNIRISVKDISATTGTIQFNHSGNSKDSTISAFRIA